MFYGARYYDPRTSVWQSADPILAKYLPTGNPKKDKKLPGMGGVFNSGNLNLFSYTVQNPVKYIDPNGKVFHQLGFYFGQKIAKFYQRFYRRARQLRSWAQGHKDLRHLTSRDERRLKITRKERIRRNKIRNQKRHYIISYILTKEFGLGMAEKVDQAGIINELQGLILHDIPNIRSRMRTGDWAFEIEDIKENRKGIYDAIRDLKLKKAGKKPKGPRKDVKKYIKEIPKKKK